jgi:hypothetical protein
LGLFPALDWEAPTKGVEAALEGLTDQAAKGDGVVRQQLVALRFYLARIIQNTASNWLGTTHSATNYAVLLDQIDNWRRKAKEPVALVTFNYDELLESAARVLPYFPTSPATMDDYTRQHEYKILKLHGSTNWWRTVSDLHHKLGEYTDAVSAAGNGSLDFGEFLTAYQKAQRQGSDSLNVTVPAIAIPVQEKSSFECPSEHLNVLNESMRKTTKLLIIGWRGMEKHFLQLWNGLAMPKQVLIVDTPTGWLTAEQQLRTVSGMTLFPINHMDEGFTKFLQSGHLRPWLEA